MKTALTVILILNDGDDSFATAITTGLQTSNLKQSTEVFELSLERYEVTDVKVAGSVTLFVDSNGVKQVGLGLAVQIVSDVKDIEECIVKGRCKKLAIKLPAWSIMQCLLASAKSESSGLVISDEVELTRTNLPWDKVFEWFIGPLLVMKEQIKDWDDSGFTSNDHVRWAQLQAIIRRLQGIVGSMSRMSIFRRKYKNLVKVLYLEALQAGIIATPPEGGGLKRRLNEFEQIFIIYVNQKTFDAAYDEQKRHHLTVWDWLFKSCHVNGRILFRDGLIDVKDIEECIVKGRCKKLAIKLPAWSIMQCLLASAKSESSSFII
nr:uncharacterized membrane protein At3g27390 [Tanacetum cinerariifolium]